VSLVLGSPAPGDRTDAPVAIGTTLAQVAAQRCPERVAAIEMAIAKAISRGRAPATIRAYASDWADFARWCAGVGVEALPAAPGTVAGYVAELAFPPDDRSALAVSSITRRLAAIGQVHSVAGQSNPATDALVHEAMRGIRRSLGVAPRHQKRAVATADIKAAVGPLGDGPAELRDRLVLLLGFATAMRRSELAVLAVEDVAEVPEGLLVHLRRSKTDQEAAGRRVEVVYGADPLTCPVRAYRSWLACARISEGPVLRQVDRHGRVLGALSGEAVGAIVQRHMVRLGYPAADFGGHSLRRGHATTAARNGASERAIMRTTGHTSTATLRGYIEEAALFSDPASSYLGL
jgi:site-specific recombinase XerD